jgi:hypothetical protein
VGHIQPKDVHAGVNQRADHFRRTGGRAQRGNNFSFPHELGSWGWNRPAFMWINFASSTRKISSLRSVGAARLKDIILGKLA